MTTKIEWVARPGTTPETWNPVTGCTKVSAGCKHCYAEQQFPRVYGRDRVAVYPDDDRPRRFTDVRTHPDRLDKPLHWRKPRTVFVNSMSDLFHDAVPDEFLIEVYARMALARKHTFQVLTKRPDRMRTFLSDPELQWRVSGVAGDAVSERSDPDACADLVATMDWPPRNVWLGVSAENQATADERIPILLDTPAAVRFVSAEPLLGPVDLSCNALAEAVCATDDGRETCIVCREHPSIDWVIVGGESGPNARPCDVAWVRSIVEQCKAAAVPCFVKQLGAHPTWTNDPELGDLMGPGRAYENRCALGIHHSKGGDPDEWPEDLRVREWPA
jgi:protein gp37